MESSPAPLPTSLKLTRRAVFICYFCMGFTFASWASRIPDVKSSLHLSDGQLGQVLFALPIGTLLCLQVSGKVVARWGSQRTTPFALPAYALTLALLALGVRPVELAAGLFLFGITGNLASISINTQGVLTEALFERPIMAAFHGAWSLAGFSGGLFGLLVTNLGVTPRLHFAIVAAVVLLVAPLVRPYLAAAVPRKDAPPAARGGPRFDPMLMQLGIIAFCSMGTEGAMFDWSGVYFKDVVHAPHSLVALGYTSFMVMMATGRFLADGLVGRFGRRKVMQTCGCTISIGLFSAVAFPQLVPCTMAFMLVGLGVSSIVPSVYSLAGRHSKVDPGIALATVSSISFLGFLMGPPLIGTVAAYSSLRCSFAIIACFGMCIPFLVGCNQQIQ